MPAWICRTCAGSSMTGLVVRRGTESTFWSADLACAAKNSFIAQAATAPPIIPAIAPRHARPHASIKVSITALLFNQGCNAPQTTWGTTKSQDSTQAIGQEGSWRRL